MDPFYAGPQSNHTGPFTNSEMQRPDAYWPNQHMRGLAPNGLGSNHAGSSGGGLLSRRLPQLNQSWLTGPRGSQARSTASTMMTGLPPATYRPYAPRGPVVPRGNTDYPGVMQGYPTNAATLRHTMPPPNTQFFGPRQQTIYRDPLTAFMAPPPAPTTGTASQGSIPPPTCPGMNAPASSLPVPPQPVSAVFGPHQQPLYLGPPSSANPPVQTDAHLSYEPVVPVPQIHHGHPDAMHANAFRTASNNHAMGPPNTQPFSPHQQATYHIPSAAHIGPRGSPGMSSISVTTAAPLPAQAPGPYYAHSPLTPFTDARNYPDAMHGHSTRAAGHAYAMPPRNVQYRGPHQQMLHTGPPVPAHPLAQGAPSPYGPVVPSPHIHHDLPGTTHGHAFRNTNNGHILALHNIPSPSFDSHQQVTYQGPLVPSQGLAAGTIEGGSPPSIDPETSDFDSTGICLSFDPEAVASHFQRLADKYADTLPGPGAVTDNYTEPVAPPPAALSQAPPLPNPTAFQAPSPSAPIYGLPSQYDPFSSLVAATHGVTHNHNHYTTNREYVRQGAPYPQHQVAAPSVDLIDHNDISTDAFVPGGAQTTVTGRVPSSLSSATQARASSSSRSDDPPEEIKWLIRWYWKQPDFRRGLTTGQCSRLDVMLAEGTEDNVKLRCQWVDRNGVLCSKSNHDFNDYVTRDRHVHEMHHHYYVGTGKEKVLYALPGVRGSASCSFCGECLKRNDGWYKDRHESKCPKNQNRLPAGVKFKGTRRPRDKA